MKTPIAKPAARPQGLTAVEVAVAVSMLALAVMTTVFYVRRAQQQQLQAEADASPLDVFEITVRPERDVLAAGEPVTFVLDVHNPTRYALDYKWTTFAGSIVGREASKFSVNRPHGEIPLFAWSIPSELVIEKSAMADFAYDSDYGEVSMPLKPENETGRIDRIPPNRRCRYYLTHEEPIHLYPDDNDDEMILYVKMAISKAPDIFTAQPLGGKWFDAAVVVAPRPASGEAATHPPAAEGKP